MTNNTGNPESPSENPITDFYERAMNIPVPVDTGLRLANFIIDLIAFYFLSILLFTGLFLLGISFVGMDRLSDILLTLLLSGPSTFHLCNKKGGQFFDLSLSHQ